MKKKRFIILLSAIFILPVIFIFMGCGKKDTKAPVEKLINVYAQKAEKKQLRPFIESVGTLNPDEEVLISSELDGVLKDVRGDEGTVVSKGQTIALVDDIDYALEIKRAEALLKQAQATLENTRLEHRRKESLYKEQLVTQQQFDDVITRLSLAEADVERAKASLSLAGQKHSKTRVISPVSGVIKVKHVEAGNYVKNGSLLFTVIRINPLKMNFTVPEKELSSLKKGQQVKFRVDAYPDKEFDGTLSLIYPSMEERTRSLQVEAKIPNSNGLLKPGLFTHVILYTGAAKDTVVIPATSLLYEGETIKVFVVEGNTAKERTVTAGQKYKIQSSVTGQQSEDKKQSSIKEYTEITEGIEEGELIVTVGQQGLFDGAKVKISE